MSGWWWLLLAALIAAGAAAWLLLRRRRRRSWDTKLAAAEAEAYWFVRELIPRLGTAESAAGMTGGWAVAAPRVAALQDRLSLLAGAAPDDRRRARAVSLRDAVGSGRDRMTTLAGDPGPEWVGRLMSIQVDVLDVLVPPTPSGSPDLPTRS